MRERFGVDKAGHMEDGGVHRFARKKDSVNVIAELGWQLEEERGRIGENIRSHDGRAMGLGDEDKRIDLAGKVVDVVRLARG